MARPEKIAVVDEIAEKIERTQSLFLTDFTGLDVEAINELRRLLRENAVEYRVVKNTLARLAAEKAGREDLKPYLVGPTAMAFGFEDPVLPAKLLSSFAQKTGKPTVKAILFEEQLYGQEVMDRLKSLPSREELLSKMVGGLKTPISQVTMVLGGLLRNFLGILEAISRLKGEGEQKEEGLPAEEKAEKKVETKAEDKAEVEAEGETGKKAKAEAELKPEEKAEGKAEAGEEEKPPEGEHNHEPQATDSQAVKEKESPEEGPENKKQLKG
jgi:large subunit ribosomal protein L10